MPFSDYLMSVSTYIDGVLYSPTYQLAQECIALLIPAGILCGIVYSIFFCIGKNLGRTLYRTVRRIFRTIRRAAMGGLFHA